MATPTLDEISQDTILEWLDRHERSPEAFAGLTWWTQRIALHAWDRLGKRYMEGTDGAIFRQDEVQHSFALVRALLLPHSFFAAPNLRQKTVDYAYAAAHIATAAEDTARIAAARIAAVTAAEDAAAAAYAAAYAAAEDAATAAVRTARTARTAAARTAADSYTYYTDAARNSATEAYAYAAADFGVLWHCEVEEMRSIGERFWMRPLYGGQINKDSARKGWQAYLEYLGLGFMVEDLVIVYDFHQDPTEAKQGLDEDRWERWQRYCDPKILNASAEVLNNPELLHRYIVEGVDDLAVNEQVRIMLVGPGGAGKTTLANRLRGKGGTQEQNIASTYGIVPHILTEDWKNWQVKPNSEPKNLLAKTFKFGDSDISLLNLQPHLWDFGGQVVFMHLHRLFFTEQVVYVVVVDSRHEQAVEPWLWQIRSVVGHQSSADSGKFRVFVLTNWQENCEREQNVSYLVHQFSDLITAESFFHFNFKEYESAVFEQFLDSLIFSCTQVKTLFTKEMVEAQGRLTGVFQEGIQPFMRLDVLRESLFGEAPKRGDHEVSVIQALVRTGSLFAPLWDEKQGIEKLQARDDLIFASTDALLMPIYAWLKQAEEHKGFISNRQKNRILESFSNENPQAEQILKILSHDKVGLCKEKDATLFFPLASAYTDPKKLVTIRKKKSADEVWQAIWRMNYMPVDLYSNLINYFWNDGKRPKEQGYIDDGADVWRSGFLLSYGGDEDILEVRLSALNERLAEVSMRVYGDANKACLVILGLNNYLRELSARNDSRLGLLSFVLLDGITDQSIYQRLIQEGVGVFKESKMSNNYFNAPVEHFGNRNVNFVGDNNQAVLGGNAQLHQDNSQHVGLSADEITKVIAALKENGALGEKVIANTQLILEMPENDPRLDTAEKKSIWSKLRGFAKDTLKTAWDKKVEDAADQVDLTKIVAWIWNNKATIGLIVSQTLLGS